VSTMSKALTLLGALLLAAPALAQDGPTARELLDGTDDMHRGSSSHGTVTMNVKTKRWTRSMSMESWSEGEEKSLIVIRSPAKEAGMATLMVDDNIWNYMPKVDRTMKVPGSLMGGSWMGSHFTNDDLVKETDIRKHYTCLSFSEDNNAYVVTVRPKPNAPVVWGKVVSKVIKDGPYMLWSRYYDERGKLKRTMTFKKVRTVQGRKLPTRIELQPADAPSERTVVAYHKIKFDVPIAADTFTLRGLKR